jgi:SNW domain-containing protein 1
MLIHREQNRDISEKIALGIAKPTTSKEALVDSRLFNREAFSTGFGADDSYNLYDKPLFQGSSAAAAIYKSAGNAGGNDESFGGGTETGIREELSKDRFQLGNATRGFEGADSSEAREGPVQFEKDTIVALDGTADLFGVESFMEAAKKGGKRSAAEDKESRKRARGDDE